MSDQKELHKYIANKKVCLIGGSPNIIGSNMGDYIDDHVVVRANCHWPVPKCLMENDIAPSHDLTKDIGSRTDILFHGGYKKTGGSFKELNQLLGLKLIVFNKQQFYWKKDLEFRQSLLERWCKCKIALSSCDDYGLNPTIGFVALDALLKCNPEQVLMCGFDFYQNPDPNWKHNPGIISHSPEKEKNIVLNWSSKNDKIKFADHILESLGENNG